MSAIEVLRTMLEIRKKPNLFVSQCCKDPFEDRKIAEANALDVALLALEINNNLVNDLLNLANHKADDIVTGNNIISVLLKNKINIVQGKNFVWKKKG